MSYARNSHCSYCGHAFDAAQPWPRTCGHCGQTTFLNPIPVTVMLVPVDGGLLAVRRGIEPGRGRLALPGGYVSLGETWQEAGAREVLEETGVRVDPATVREFAVRSTPEGALLIFGLAPALAGASLLPFRPDAETLECLVIDAPAEMAFPLHTAAVHDYFARRIVPAPGTSTRSSAPGAT